MCVVHRQPLLDWHVLLHRESQTKCFPHDPAMPSMVAGQLSRICPHLLDAVHMDLGVKERSVPAKLPGYTIALSSRGGFDGMLGPKKLPSHL